ncbi:MAG TPA: erythromycin esterase family protein [Methylomirabilota bacterium]|jgi:erythromycin esterase-like protein|nr:erythromycin esterase family protein [Methylomirabilota bacterium]
MTRRVPSSGGGPLALVREALHPLTGAPEDYASLVALIGEARVVLLGEASHGTHEFYRARALITRRLIETKGFRAVAVEADWPDAYRVNRYVLGRTGDQHAVEALGDFRRFPAWMWRNADVVDFIGWLRHHNETRPEAERVGFYGLDLYSLHASIEAVLGYLDTVDPAAASRARHRYACFDHYGADPQAYGYATAIEMSPSCEDEVVAQLVDLRRRAAEYAARDGRVDPDAAFSAEQNARLITNAEGYYRAMFAGPAASWNLRDTHMADTLDALLDFLDARQSAAKVVVWAHNSHLGDARATEMSTRGEVNLGQLARERHPGTVFGVGFTTYTGTVTAASDWGAPAERKQVRPALPGSYEALLHEVAVPRFVLTLADRPEAAAALMDPRLERAIGVIYRPRSERASHYFHARLPRQFDAVVHFDETRAVEPLERSATWEAGELPDTYPRAV